MLSVFFFNDTATTEIYTLSLHDALPIYPVVKVSWEDAKAFCRWLTEKERREGIIGSKYSYQLPRDWEWSVAVGLTESGEGTAENKDEKIPDVYPWGRQWPPPYAAGNYDSSLGVDIFEWTSPVGSFES